MKKFIFLLTILFSLTFITACQPPKDDDDAVVTTDGGGGGGGSTADTTAPTVSSTLSLIHI